MEGTAIGEPIDHAQSHAVEERKQDTDHAITRDRQTEENIA